MTRVGLPPDLTSMIADRAMQNARRDLVKRGWKSASSLSPVSEQGRVGISSTLNYVLKQNSGFDEFIMWWVKNRVVPLGCPQGDGPHIRFGNPDAVGTPGMVDIPHKGKVFRPVRWKHPGLKPKRFMETAITQAIKDSRADIKKTLIMSLRGGY